MTIIDTHCHVWGQDLLAYPFGPQDGLAPPETVRDVAALESTLTDAGVGGALLIQPRVYGYDHAYLYDVVHAAGGQYRAMPLVNVMRTSGVAELRRHAADSATAGARVIALGSRPASWLLSTTADLVWSEMEILDLPVGFLIDAEQVSVIEQVARTHAGLTVIVDHMARLTPDRAAELIDPLRRLGRLPNTMMKISSVGARSRETFPYRDVHPLISAMADIFGPERLMWGSDWPHVAPGDGYGHEIAAVREALSSMHGNELDAVFGLTALSVFAFGSSMRGTL